jgi:N-acetylmuramoyl-L-alanine amidase
MTNRLNLFFSSYKLIVFLLLVIVCVYLPANSLVSSEETEKYKIKTVVIDPGHGGIDPGALGKKSLEKDIVLSVAKKLGKYIEEYFDDVQVIFTRKSDKFIELHKRADIANKNKADLFISLHANSNRNRNAYGTETYAMGLHTDEQNLEVAKLENSVITFESDYTTKYEGYDPNSAESFIIFSLMQNTYLEQSLEFASFVQDQFRERAKRADRGVKQAGFLVLWKTTMPSVLVEIGYISNPNEEKFLNSDQGQDYVASAIFRAFRDYKASIESKSDFSKIITSNEEEIKFKVQISSSRKQIPLDSDFFKNMENVEEIKVNKMFKYVVGDETNYKDITEYREKIKMNFPDAFIIALKNGKIITLKEALKEINY